MSYICRIPPVNGERCHLLRGLNESGTAEEPKRAFWTNETVKALMRTVPQPEYISVCGKVRGDWRSIQVSDTPFDGELCGKCKPRP